MLDAEPLNRRAHFVRHTIRALIVGAGEHEYKLLAAVSGDKITWTSSDRRQRPSDLGQHRVAGLMTETVVVVTEVIDVDHDDGKRRRFTQRPPPLVAEEFLEVAVVGDASERIGAGEPMQRLRRLFEFGRPPFQLSLQCLDRRAMCLLARQMIEAARREHEQTEGAHSPHQPEFSHTTGRTATYNRPTDVATAPCLLL